MDDEPDRQLPADVLEIETPAHFAALGHPLRQRVLFALRAAPATTGQLADRLRVPKGNVAHHLKVLREAGLIRVAETRRVRGGHEHSYERAARRIEISDPEADSTAALLHAVRQEVAASPSATADIRLGHLRMSPAKARELRLALNRLLDEVEEDPEGEPVHGVLIALFQQS